MGWRVVFPNPDEKTSDMEIPQKIQIKPMRIPPPASTPSYQNSSCFCVKRLSNDWIVGMDDQYSVHHQGLSVILGDEMDCERPSRPSVSLRKGVDFPVTV